MKKIIEYVVKNNKAKNKAVTKEEKAKLFDQYLDSIDIGHDKSNTKAYLNGFHNSILCLNNLGYSDAEIYKLMHSSLYENREEVIDGLVLDIVGVSEEESILNAIEILQSINNADVQYAIDILLKQSKTCTNAHKKTIDAATKTNDYYTALYNALQQVNP